MCVCVYQLVMLCSYIRGEALELYTDFELHGGPAVLTSMLKDAILYLCIFHI